MIKISVKIFKLIILLLVISSISIYLILRSSLATLEGDIYAHVRNAVEIDRDKNGVPTIRAQTREDLSFGLGYLHAQERLFQMDLLRRNSAGELAEMFGAVALPHDKKIRVHQFRARAEQYVRNIAPEYAEVLNQYTKGVNQGIADLASRPFEYWLLNKTPSKWRPADSLLVLYSMYIDLQHEDGAREKLLGRLKQNLMPDVFQFLTPKGSQWDASIDGSKYTHVDIPNNKLELTPILQTLSHQAFQDKATDDALFIDAHEALKGSNNWAVSGALTASGSAIVADDMHLGIGVPNIWYRASLRFDKEGVPVAVDGVTLPGVPVTVVGSNHKVAWGFTNSYGDWNDLITLKLDESGTQYLTPDGFTPFDVNTETILINDQSPIQIEIKKTMWGPVIGANQHGELIAMRWVAHDKEGVNFDLLDLEHADSIEDAITIANGAGIPAQNMVVGDADGNIAWTIAGAIPQKSKTSLTAVEQWQHPQDWSTGEFKWLGYLPENAYPVIKNPKQQRIWTANSRVVGGDMYAQIGNGGYALGARSQQIRNRLMAKKQFTEKDLFAIQNDTKADFLVRWHQLLNDQILTPEFVKKYQLESVKSALMAWQQQAAVDSVGYLFVRQFRIEVRTQLFADLQQQLFDAQPTNKINLRLIRHQLEVPMWQMITQQPRHLLPQQYPDWGTFLQQMVINTETQLLTQFGDLKSATWGNYNTTKIQHPLSKAIPALSGLLDMPNQAASGDSYMPKVQGRSFGASQRMVVTPGQEHNGIMQMPVGQALHPLSPYFGAGHDDWLNEQPTPLLPTETKYKMRLIPKTAI